MEGTPLLPGLVEREGARLIEQISIAEHEILESLQVWKTLALKLLLERYDREPMSLAERMLVLAAERELSSRTAWQPTARLYALPPDGAA